MTDNRADNITVRKAGPGDGARLSLAANATFLETFAGEISGQALVQHCGEAHSPAFLENELANGAQGWLAELDAAPVGYALVCSPSLAAAREGDIELKKIYLLSRFHGSGVATRMLDAAIAASQAFQRMLLGVKADNFRAIAFYKKQGFSQIAVRQFDVGGTLYDDVVLARTLSPEQAQ